MTTLVGKKDSIKKIITAKDIELFADVSLDNNPIHLDPEYASKTLFKQRIAHGFLVGSLISAVIANKLPGHGSIYLKQEMNFKKPVFIDDEIEAVVEILEEMKPNVYRIDTKCINQNGDLVIDGYAIIKKV